ncbi:MAG: bile acid:sodium symporter family protein [Methanobacteriaceae archaeon]|nr:bile acid:sodium symporter family protein [Methanobacteriaceae archaeon]
MLKEINRTVEKFMIVIIAITILISFFYPKVVTSYLDPSYVNYFLMIVMLSMGLNLNIDDFIVIAKQPKYIALGTIAQFVIMPLLAYAVAILFNFDIALIVGLVLVGTCPGGVASNVITYLSGGDVPLSIGMTSVNTVLATFLTPLITFLILKTTVQVDTLAIFLSIIQIVIIPLVLGFIINHYFDSAVKRVSDIFPTFAILSVIFIIAIVISYNVDKILSFGILIFLSVVILNLLGHICGFILGKLFRMPLDKTKTFSIEIAMQNSALATTLATNAFPTLAMASVPGAVYSIWQNLFGAVVAYIFKRLK